MPEACCWKLRLSRSRKQFEYYLLRSDCFLSCTRRKIFTSYPDKKKSEIANSTNRLQVQQSLSEFCREFPSGGCSAQSPMGLFGYMASMPFDILKTLNSMHPATAIPDVLYRVSLSWCSIFTNEMTLLETQTQGLAKENIFWWVRWVGTNHFSQTGSQRFHSSHNVTDVGIEDGLSNTACGDVFQMCWVEFQALSFIGDEFNVYRSLRSINPSPYLFYFDFWKL